MTEIKVAQLKQQVLTSKVLSEQEKQDWLLMLPLMNDKQLGDLETILETPAAARGQPSGTLQGNPVSPPQGFIPLTPIQSSNSAAAQAILAAPKSSFIPPKLTHIANVPNTVVAPVLQNQQLQPRPQPSRNQQPQQPRPATKSAWDAELKRELSEPELPAPKLSSQQPVAPALKSIPSHPLTTPKPAAPIPPKTPASASAVKPQQAEQVAPPREDFWSTLLEPKRAQVFAEVAAATREGRDQTGPVITAIHGLADVSLLSISSLRQITAKVLITTLQNLVRQHGYEYVLAAFEKSPLYRLYLTAGSLALEKNMTFEQLSGSKSAEELPMSRLEFEMVVDILKNMRVN